MDLITAHQLPFDHMVGGGEGLSFEGDVIVVMVVVIVVVVMVMVVVVVVVVGGDGR